MSDPIELNGKITALDFVKKTVKLLGEDNAPHGLAWDTEPLDTYFKKQKVGFYQTIKYFPDTYLIKSAHYWQEGKEVMAKILEQNGGSGKFFPKKPRFTLEFTIPLAQFENAKVGVEGNSPEECKAGVAALMDSIAPNHPTTRDIVQRFKERVI
jgi:hypothetical protein